jgi:lipooligosaccharide transport system permease protein
MNIHVELEFARNSRCRHKNILGAEIAWSATKSVGAATIMLIVLGLMGFVQIPIGLLLIPLAFFGGLAFGAIGMFFTGIIPTIDMFNLPIFLFITPMFLFSGTFFPVSNLPVWMQPFAIAFPLYHLAELARRFSIGTSETPPIISIGYLTVFFLIFTSLALGAMRKRLIQ